MIDVPHGDERDCISSGVRRNIVCIGRHNLSQGMCVKCWDSNSIGDKGGRQGRIGVNSDGFLRRRARGASTPDLASACVLHPLNR